MNRFKKFTSLFDREKLNLYKRFLKKNEETPAQQSPPPEKKESPKTPALDIPIDITPESIIRKPKFYITSGPHLYVSKLLNSQGPLTGNQIWNLYLKDAEALKTKELSSKNYLKKTILPTMYKQGKLKKIGYSPLKEEYVGLALIPEKAFLRTDPQILVSLKPRPKIRRLERAEFQELLKMQEAETERNE